jgi:hypothetical protein
MQNAAGWVNAPLPGRGGRGLGSQGLKIVVVAAAVGAGTGSAVVRSGSLPAMQLHSSAAHATAFNGPTLVFTM